MGFAYDRIGGKLFFSLPDTVFIRTVGILAPDLSIPDDQKVCSAVCPRNCIFQVFFQGEGGNLFPVNKNMGCLTLRSGKKILVSHEDCGQKEQKAYQKAGSLSGFAFGGMSSILFSLAGAALSLLVMWFCRRLSLFDMVGVSILGGVFHNIGQFLMAAYVVKTFGVFSYFPVLLFAGTAAGAAIGLLGGLVLKRIGKAIRID